MEEGLGLDPEYTLIFFYPIKIITIGEMVME